MKMMYLVLCGLLVLGCSKDDKNPDDEDKGTNGKGTYFEVTISGPLVDGVYKWKGENVTQFVAAYEHLGAVTDMAMILYPYYDNTPVIGGMEIPPRKGLHHITDAGNDLSTFSIGFANSTFSEFDVNVNVTEFEETGEGSFRLLKRMYGTFEGTVIEETHEVGAQGQIHTVKGKFGYDSAD